MGNYLRDLSEFRDMIEENTDAVSDLLEQWDSLEHRPRAARAYYENLLSSLVGLLSDLIEAIDAERET